MTYEQAEVNVMLSGLGEYRGGSFNGICTYRFMQPEPAAAFAEYAFDKQLHRLKAKSTHGATREEVALEWERRAAEREEILAWGRTTGMTRQVVAHYRAERHVGAWTLSAHHAAGRLIEKAHPTIADPVHYAGVMIEWAERNTGHGSGVAAAACTICKFCVARRPHVVRPQSARRARANRSRWKPA